VEGYGNKEDAYGGILLVERLKQREG